MKIADVARLTDLDRLTPRHPLVKGLPRTRMFESIGLDGYDPAAIELLDQSLLAYVTSKRRYHETQKSYNHPVWLHLQERNPSTRPSERWMAAVLAERGALLFNERDEANAYELGFDQFFPYFSDGAEPPSEVYLGAERFADLDGLLALMLLHRGTIDRAPTDQQTWLPYLRSLLSGAASHFAEEQGFQGEMLDTWRLLVETRILTWRPEITPTVKDMELAQQQLLDERKGKRRAMGSIDTGLPDKRRCGRAERRWRRQVTIRANLLAILHPSSAIAESKLTRWNLLKAWLTDHRDANERHLVRAEDLALNGATDLPEEPPLRMPSELIRWRRRPETNIERWNVYGNRVPYDLIPVEAESPPHHGKARRASPPPKDEPSAE